MSRKEFDSTSSDRQAFNPSLWERWISELSTIELSFTSGPGVPLLPNLSSAGVKGRFLMSQNQESIEIQGLFEANREWAAQVERDDPGFFGRLAKQQKPKFLWIGCSDSRVPANQITGLMPGEVFVHRNVANLVMHTDLNCMSVVDFAIQTLQVRHVIICGHYGCAGVRAAMEQETVGVVDHWLSGLRDLWEERRAQMVGFSDEEALKRFCEINVRQQVRTLCRTTVIKQAWARGQALDVHGWIYGIDNGLLKDLGDRFSSLDDLQQADAL